MLNKAPFSCPEAGEDTVMKHPCINSKDNSTFHMIIMQSESMKEGEKELPRSTVPSTHVMSNTKVSKGLL